MTLVLFHVATAEDWEARSGGEYRPAGYTVEGFVHCSERSQLPGVIERYYSGRDDLVLLTIDATALEPEVVWEDTTGRGERFPHVYGPIPLAAIVEVEAFPIDGPS